MKKIFAISLILSALIAGAVFNMPGADSRIASYLSGDAVAYNGRAVFCTTNSGHFELFTLENGHIKKQGDIFSDERAYNRFFDAVLTVEGGDLYAYLVNGRYLYRYRITNAFGFDLVKKTKDNSGDIFFNLDKTDKAVITVGERGVKVWDREMRVIDSHPIENTHAENIRFSRNGNYIYEIFADTFNIIDAFFRAPVSEADLSVSEDHPRHSFEDIAAGTIYVVDDSYLSKIHFDGQTEKFKHISRVGYDADGVDGSAYVYFSDGIGIVKIRKSDMKPIDWAYTTKLGPGQGWSMGLRTVRDAQGEKTIVFNGDSILAFDSDLNLLDFYAAREAIDPIPARLSLDYDKSRGAPGTGVSLRGQGFAPNEDIRISLEDAVFIARTSSEGSFARVITVPAARPQITDIKAEGLSSGLTYSISFTIE